MNVIYLKFRGTNFCLNTKVSENTTLLKKEIKEILYF